MEEQTLDYAIVKLRKGDVVQYPITKPQLVMYDLDEEKGYAETVYTKIDALERGRKNYFNAYSVAHDEYVNGKQEPKLFINEDVYALYLAAQNDTVMKKIKRLLVPNNIGDILSWSTYKDPRNDGGNFTVNDFAVWFYYEGEPGTEADSDSEKLFSMKHFVSLMNGNAPDELMVKSSGKVYNTVTKFEVEVVEPGECSLTTEPYKALVLEMTSEDGDLIRFEASPSIYDFDSDSYVCKAIAYSPANVEYRMMNTKKANG